MRAVLMAFAAAGCLRGAAVTPDDTDPDDTDVPGDSGGPGSPPSAPAVTLSYGIKTFVFSWPAVTDADEITVYETVDGVEATAATLDGDATEARVTVPLFARVAALYRVEVCNAAGCASSAPLSIEPPLLGAIGYVKPLATGEFDAFGEAIATCADGSTVAVGAPSDDSAGSMIDRDWLDDSAPDAGAVSVFARGAGGEWTHQAYLKPTNANTGDRFGTSVALSSDCATLAVGAIGEGGAGYGNTTPDALNGLPGSGAVYVFQRDETGQWSQQSYLKAFPAEGGVGLGGQVALSGDGTILAASALNDDGGSPGVFTPGAVPHSEGQVLAGAVVVFRLDSTLGWTPEAHLKGSKISALDTFGRGLSLDDRGEWLAVGVDGEDAAALNGGGVYLYRRDPSWAEVALLHPPTTAEGSSYGITVSMSGDGSTLVLGADPEEPYVYSRDGDEWLPEQRIVALGAEPAVLAHGAVSVSADGAWLAVGAPRDDAGNAGVGAAEDAPYVLSAGAVLLFARESPGDPFVQREVVRAPAPMVGGLLGLHAALSADAGTLVVGHPEESRDGTGVHTGDEVPPTVQDGVGAVYLY